MTSIPGVPCASVRLLDLESLHAYTAPFLLTSLSPHLVHFLDVFLSSDPALHPFKSIVHMSPLPQTLPLLPGS